jgi:DNA-binding transcriptional MerR regulator
VPDDAPIYGPDDLAERAGVSRRTVRYYVQRGLLPAPAGLGRGKHYSEAHLARLIRIRELQEAGVPLEGIAERLEGRTGVREVAPQQPQQSAWTRVALADDIELHVRGRRLSAVQLERLVRAVQQTIEGDEP